ELIPMGAPEASPIERPKEINTATKNAKEKGRGMQTTSRQAYALLLFSSMTMSDTLPWFGKVPSANLAISNMKGPTEQLYLAGAPMVVFTGLPLLPPAPDSTSPSQGAGSSVVCSFDQPGACFREESRSVRRTPKSRSPVRP